VRGIVYSVTGDPAMPAAWDIRVLRPGSEALGP
jgi:hypothetical protein